MVRLLAKDLEKRCGASASAVALACCSRQLADIVLDSVWEEVRGLVRLMQCLSPDTWEIRDCEFVSIARPGPLVLVAYWSIDFHTPPLYQGMDPILELCS